MFQCFKSHFQHQPLLRIHGFGFTRGNPEEVGVEAGHIGQKAAPLRRHPAGSELVRIVVFVGIPTVGRDFADPVPAVSQEVPVALRACRAAGKTAADPHHRHRLGGGDPRSLVELLRQRVPLVGGHRRNSVENRSHQKIPLSLPAEADSTCSNNSSNTLPAESSAAPAESSCGTSRGASSSARYAAKDEMVGWLNSIFADRSTPRSFCVARRTAIAIIESSPSSGNG